MADTNAGGDADTGSDVDRPDLTVDVEVDRLAHRVEHSCRHGLGVGDRFDFDERDELVAAHSSDGVRLPEDLAQAVADGKEQLVTDEMPERVVDALEPVEVDVEDGRVRATLLAARDHRVDSFEDHRAVREAGEAVVHRQPAELRRALFDRAHRTQPAGGERVDQQREAAPRSATRCRGSRRRPASASTDGRAPGSLVLIDQPSPRSRVSTNSVFDCGSVEERVHGSPRHRDT